MILIQNIDDTQHQIHAYEPGAITVNETIYHHSLIVSADTLITDWPPSSLQTLTATHFEPIFALKPEIIILGTGLHFIMPPAKQLAPLYQKQYGVECMDTGAACRTYTALVSEGRNVVAALLIK